VSERRDEALREAFQALGESAPGPCSEEDRERVWLAVSGELPAAERRALVERMATDRALAEAWRMANELWRASQETAEAKAERRAPAWTWSMEWLAAAAVLMVVVTGAVVLWRGEPGGNVLRDQTPAAVESLVAPDAVLPRDAFRLRWTPGPAGSRYEVRVTTEELRLLATAADLTAPELVVTPAQLVDVASGARVLWQVDLVLPDGARVASQTFVNTVG
jgi:hypothetical protein